MLPKITQISKIDIPPFIIEINSKDMLEIRAIREKDITQHRHGQNLTKKIVEDKEYKATIGSQPWRARAR